METALLQTKLYIPPTQPEFVSRPRLIERLNKGLRQNQGFGRKLTLISAPAGFGKTTLVSDWLRQLDVSTAWISLDESDNDPIRFLAYFITALQTIDMLPEPVVQQKLGTQQEPVGLIGKGALSALQSSQPPPTEAILISLINEIAAIPNKYILILDDYHLIEAQPIHDALAFLLERLPPQMHLVVATRDDPHLPLARLRARGQLNELRAADLRFTSAEAAEFLNQVMGLNLSGKDIAALETRTEGWIAGLQLAALALQGTISMHGQQDATRFIKSFTGSHHFILDYLLEEVLEQQPEGIQTFLLQTSILDRLCGPLCDAVCSVETDILGNAPPLGSSASGQETLEYLQHANLFIVPLDEERRWYRYHHLFSDLLRQRLRQIQPEQVSTLHRRTSEWYEQNGFIDEAIEHALRGEDFERAAHLIEEHVDALWQRGEHTKLRRWLDGLPTELVFSKSQLCILNAWYLFASGQHGAAERSLQAAEKALDSSTDRAPETAPLKQGQPPDSDKMKLRGRVAAIRAFLASHRGDASGIIQYSRQALEYLPKQDLTWRSSAAIALGDAYGIKGELVAAYQARLEASEASKASGDIYLIMIANLKLAITLRMKGQLQRILEICRQQLQLAHESGISQTAVVGWLLAIWGEVLAEINDLDEAIHQAKKGVELTERGYDVAMLGWSHLCLMRVLFSRGDLAGAEEIVQKMENTAREYDMPPWITNLMAAWQARIWLAQDKLEAASRWMVECGLDADGELQLIHEVEHIVLARTLIAQGRLDETTGLLQRLLEAAETGARTSRVIEILMLQALTFQADGDTARTMIALERSLALAEPGGFIRIFVDEGPPMEALLRRMKVEDGKMKEYVHKLLAAFADKEFQPPSLSPQPLIEPLSERELEVLQLIAEGLTNSEIAARLYLTLNTVKVHTRNIYGKLDAHNRTQAVARARALGILTPSNRSDA